jgi:hypothetical protein
MKLTEENPSTRRKPCPSATLPTKNPTWTDPGSNPDLRIKRPATNRLSHGLMMVINLMFELVMLVTVKNTSVWDEMQCSLEKYVS